MLSNNHNDSKTFYLHLKTLRSAAGDYFGYHDFKILIINLSCICCRNLSQLKKKNSGDQNNRQWHPSIGIFCFRIRLIISFIIFVKYFQTSILEAILLL